jgi:hypothetical protein
MNHDKSKNESLENTPHTVLHLYPQSEEHGEGRIVGSRKALTALRDQLDHIVEHEAGYVHHGYEAADGEGYDLAVELLDRGCHDPAWEERPEPYYVVRRAAREHGMMV